MKSLVVYSSQTGNTKKIAEAVFETLDSEKEIFSIDQAPDPSGYDFIALGFWLMAGKPDPKAQEYLPKINSGQSLFLFATHGARSDSDHVKNAVNFAKSLVSKAEFAGSFTCQGELSSKIKEKIRSKPAPPPWLEDAPPADGHPDDADIAALKKVLGKLA